MLRTADRLQMLATENGHYAQKNGNPAYARKFDFKHSLCTVSLSVTTDSLEIKKHKSKMQL